LNQDVPSDGCDAHAHLIGPPPFAPGCFYIAAEATVADYLAMLDGLGLCRGVVVQPLAHGTDNRILLAALRRDPLRLRGVAVVSPAVEEAELAAMRAAGVRGLRLGTTIGLEALEVLASRAARHGLHIQVLTNADELVTLGPRLSTLGVPLVIDHMGHPAPERGIEDRGFQTLLDLVNRGVCYVKLSAAYRISTHGAPFEDTLPFASALVDAGPDRVLWGSDWPHLAMGRSTPNTELLFDLLHRWIPQKGLRRKILVTNPARLYGF
jgi:predicted TIM-barrel fold metal-dependent hydrolase